MFVANKAHGTTGNITSAMMTRQIYIILELGDSFEYIHYRDSIEAIVMRY